MITHHQLYYHLTTYRCVTYLIPNQLFWHQITKKCSHKYISKHLYKSPFTYWHLDEIFTRFIHHRRQYDGWIHRPLRSGVRDQNIILLHSSLSQLGLKSCLPLLNALANLWSPVRRSLLTSYRWRFLSSSHFVLHGNASVCSWLVSLTLVFTL